MKRKKTTLDRLTRDAMAARAAGMSYGKYKALHPHTEELEPEEEIVLDDDRRNMICLHCGKSFVAYGHEKRKKYCSDECREKAQYATYRTQHPFPMATCGICGVEISAKNGRKYCSGACRAAANRIHQAERNAQRGEKRRELRNA